MRLVFALENGKYIKEFLNSDVHPIIGESVSIDLTSNTYKVVDILNDYIVNISICYLELKN